MSKKYIYNVTVPVTGSIQVLVESDEEIKSMNEAFEIAMEAYGKSSARFALQSIDSGEVHEVIDGIMMGDEWETHLHLNRGNVCYAVCPETYWDIEEIIEEEEE